MNDDRLYLLHVRDCIDRIEAYTKGGEAEFLSDPKTQDAVPRNLHTLSESTQRLSTRIKARHADIDWRSISAFRNVLVHNYLGIDVKRVWDIIERDLPVLKVKVMAMLEEFGGNGSPA